MILVVQHVQQVSVERMNLIQARELLQDGAQLLVEGRLRELDLPHVELPDAVYRAALVNHRRRASLRLGQDNVHKVLGRRNDRQTFEVVLHHRGG